MKTFLAIYTGTTEEFDTAWGGLDDLARKAKMQEGMKAWEAWVERHASIILDQGGPLGKTKSVSMSGVSDIRNAMTGYVIVRAESHQSAAELFRDHPHFAIFPGKAVEIMECLPIPDMA